MNEVFILLGGNLKDKSKIFEETRKLIGERIGMVTKQSSVYVTEPWGFDSELFWNQALIVITTLNPHEILQQSQKIEKMMGRIKKSDQYEARVMDIDLIFYNDLILNTSNLTLPHPKIGDRKFVLIPLNEIAPKKRHPVTGLRVQEMLWLCSDQLNVDRID
ncbi:MAG TPA: 2-amino-4-hydroxy-6-hydroxymethyldihydropteridine diphosphokinase [Prolixibacteraceae bacterium]|nr:2-amino-4-hydroxy-6-hydroxymethyldihydropteridine diphosphokinase [Prolixibacteraceae bacterium]